jgi:hypothetical protein
MPTDADRDPLRKWTRIRATEGFRLEDAPALVRNPAQVEVAAVAGKRAL